MNISTILTTTTLALALVGIAYAAAAATLFTPPVELIGNSNFDCQIVNVSEEQRIVKIQALDGGGNVIAEGPEVSLQAGSVAILGVGPTSGYCKFTVKGSTKHFRAAGYVVNLDLGTVTIVPAQ